MKFTDEEINMIASVIMHEVGNCSAGSKIAVTNVILNRLNDGRFGDSIYEVLHADGQFEAIHNYYDQEILPDKDCMECVMQAIEGTDNTLGALYYCNMNYIDDRTKEWFNSLDFLFEMDGQNFYK